MKRLSALAGIVLGTFCLAPQAQAQAKTTKPPCDASTTLASFHASQVKGTFPGLQPETCNSLMSVINRLFNTSKAGGRKLEKDKPLDVKAAEQERQAAMAEPEYAEMLKPLLAEETDPNRRLLIEAAMLDDFGHYQARDLVLQQLAASLGISK